MREIPAWATSRRLPIRLGARRRRRDHPDAPGVPQPDAAVCVPEVVGHAEPYGIFVVAAAVNLLCAWWLTFVWVVGNGDAYTRTANAFYVLFSRMPHLAAIGFVWPPLPSFLQLPLLPVGRWIGHAEFAGPLLSSLVGAMVLVLLNAVLARLGTPRRLRWPLLVLTALNPTFLYLAANGMSEIVLLCFLLLVTLGYLLLPERVRPAVIIGAGLFLAFFTRYEALAAIAGAVAALSLQAPRSGQRWRDALEGRLVVTLTPPLYAIGLWLFWNWLIKGDPLFFARSAYSLAAAPDVARVLGQEHFLYPAWGSATETVAYAASRLTHMNLAFLPAVAAVAVLAAVRRDRWLAGLLLLLLSVPAFNAWQVYRGSLPSYARYWVYATPFATILAGAAYSATRGWPRRLLVAALTLLLLASLPYNLLTMRDPRNSIDEQRIHSYLLSPGTEADLRQRDRYWRIRHDAPLLARVIDERSRDGLVLMDSENAYGLILASRYPERFVITSDLDFQRRLTAPQQSVRFVLVIDPQANRQVGAQRDMILRQYPQLYADGAPWAELDYDFTETLEPWRLYRVKVPGG